MNQFRFLVGAMVAIICGPVLTVLAAELSLAMKWKLPVPVVDRWMALALLNELRVIAFVLAAIVVALVVRRRVPSVLGLLGKSAVLLFLGTSSILFFTVPVLNSLYSRYAPVISGSTEWVENYSEQQFMEIRVGMSEVEVVQKAGKPLEKVPSIDREIWVYSRIGDYDALRDKGFHQRAVALTSGRVTEIYRRYLTAEHVPY